jgi:hypothetical protein
MKKPISDIERVERAELMQSMKALYIPLSLFLSCVSFSAGAFLIYNNESFGWGFIALTGLLALSAFIALCQFQNPYRAKGIISKAMDESEAVKE